MKGLCYFNELKIVRKIHSNDSFALSSFQNELYLESQGQLFTN